MGTQALFKATTLGIDSETKKGRGLVILSLPKFSLSSSAFYPIYVEWQGQAAARKASKLQWVDDAKSAEEKEKGTERTGCSSSCDSSSAARGGKKMGKEKEGEEARTMGYNQFELELAAVVGGGTKVVEISSELLRIRGKRECQPLRTGISLEVTFLSCSVVSPFVFISPLSLSPSPNFLFVRSGECTFSSQEDPKDSERSSPSIYACSPSPSVSLSRRPSSPSSLKEISRSIREEVAYLISLVERSRTKKEQNESPTPIIVTDEILLAVILLLVLAQRRRDSAGTRLLRQVEKRFGENGEKDKGKESSTSLLQREITALIAQMELVSFLFCLLSSAAPIYSLVCLFPALYEGL